MADSRIHLQNTSFGNLIEQLENRSSAKAPLEAVIEVTKLCSVKCSHCYIGDQRWILNPSELKTEEWEAIFLNLQKAGILCVTFTGGEPLIRKDFATLWEKASDLGFLLQLYTNATMVSEKWEDLFINFPPRRVEVSVYGTQSKTYESLTGVSGSFDRFLKGLELLLKWNCNVLLKAPLLKENIHQIEDFRKFANRYGLSIHFSGLINLTTGIEANSGKGPCSTRALEEDLARIEIEDGQNFPLPVSSVSDADLFECGAGSKMVYITASGKLQMCNLTAHRGIDLRATDYQLPFARFEENRQTKRSSKSPCLSCDLRGICHNCPGFAQLETGDEQGAVEWICRQTHIKANLLGMKHCCDSSHPGALLANDNRNATLSL